MAQAKRGDLVRVHYKGTLEDGTVFDSSEGRDPLEFVLGAGQVIPGFDNAVEGMNIGDVKVERIPYLEAYGPRRPELIARFERSELPSDLELEEGDHVQLQDPSGRTILAEVVELTETEIVLDANHKLAGQDLTFRIQLDALVTM